MSDLKCRRWLSPLSKLKALIWPGCLVQKTEISNYHTFAFIFSFLLHAFILLLLFSPFHFSLQMLYDCLTFSAGIILPVHCVCGLHHVAVLHAGRRHRQCSNLCLSHHRAECLPVHHSWSRRANSVAGKAVKFQCELTVASTWMHRRKAQTLCTCTEITSSLLRLICIWGNLFKR